MIETVPLNKLKPSPLNPRKRLDPAAVDELAASIKASGLLQNLVVRKVGKGNGAKYEIAAGERRYRAMQQLVDNLDLPKDHPVPVVIRELTDLQLVQLATSENIARRDMEPLEEARAFQALLQLGSDIETIVSETGLSLTTIRRRLALLEGLAPVAAEILDAGRMTLGQAEVLATVGHEMQEQILDTYLENDEEEGVRLDIAPRDLRHQLTRSGIPASQARFPLSLYTGPTAGPTLFDPDAETVLLDRGQFLDLQAKWVEEYTEDLLAQGWSWVDVEEWFSNSNYETVQESDPTFDKAELGVIITFAKYRGDVEVHYGLRKPKRPTSSRREAPTRDPMALTEPHRVAIVQHRTHALQRAVLADDGYYALLAVTNWLLQPSWTAFAGTAGNHHSGRPDPAPEVDAALARYAQIPASAYGARSQERMEALLELTPGQLEELFRALVAKHLAGGNGDYPGSERVDPQTARYFEAATSGSETQGLPTLRELGPEWLQLYSKPALAGVATRLGIETPSNATKARLVVEILGSSAPGLDRPPAELLLRAAPIDALPPEGTYDAGGDA